MTAQPVSDGTWQLVPSAEPGGWNFRVALAADKVRPGLALAPNTTYAAADIPNKPRLNDGWKSYVLGLIEPSQTPGYLWANFVRALPTTPTVADGPEDDVWGPTRTHTYLDLISNSRPTRADLWETGSSTVTRTLSTGATRTLSTGAERTIANVAPVLEVKEKDLGQGLSEVQVVTVNNPMVSRLRRLYDEDSGQVLDTTETHYLQTTAPAGQDLDSSGIYREVKPVKHNWWVVEGGVASGLAGLVNARTWPSQERGIYWPPVLEAYRFTDVVAESADRLTKLLQYSMREGYSGECKCDNTLWWQKDALVLAAPQTMTPSGINIRGNLMSIAIPECLHNGFVYEEENYVIDITSETSNYLEHLKHLILTWTFAPNGTSWPAYLDRYVQTPKRGGFEILWKRFYAPAAIGTADFSSRECPWEFVGFYG